jgi:hypothetical protein
LASAYEVADDLFFHVIAPDGYWAGVAVNCNDLVYWACADAEPIETDADVALLRECLQATDEACGPARTDKECG